MSINSWRSMWVLAIFDFPTQTKQERRAYTDFRKTLLKNGFTQMQYSVYIKNLPTFNKSKALVNKIGPQTPAKGICCFLFLTDKQFGMSKNFYGSMQDNKKLPEKHEQLLLFEES